MQHLLAAALFAGAALSQTTDPALTGTWSTKSNKTFTGPGFYNPETEAFTEPTRTGISYSFSDDGYYEEAYYRAIANPVNPACPSAIIQWQHGKYEKLSNGSLQLTPIAVDGRQLLSAPCDYDTAILTRYSQPELFDRYSIGTNNFHNTNMLQLYKFDGSPMPPMYIAYQPPEMLPTTTLNPTTTSAAGAAATGGSKKQKFRRSHGKVMDIVDEVILPKNKRALRKKRAIETVDTERWWWVGVVMTGMGGVLYFCF